MSAEAKVGLLVIVVALLAAGVAIFLSDALRAWRAWEIVVQFANVHGLRKGDSVRLRGHPIGRVKQVEISPHARFPGKDVAVTCTIFDPNAILYSTDSFTITQGALVGDKHLAITQPEGARPERARLTDGDVVGGAPGSTAEVIMDETRLLLEAARTAIESVKGVLADAQMQEDLKSTVGNLRAATERAVALSARAVEVVDTFARAGHANEARLAAIMDNLIAASDDIATTTQRVHDMVAITPVPAQVAAAGENLVRASEDLAAIAENARARVEESTIDEDVERAVANLQEASENIREMSASAAELAGDEQLSADIRATMENARAASESLREAAAHAESLLGDEQINEDLRATVASLRDTAETSTETMQRADRVMTNIESTMETVRRTQEIVTDIDTRARVQFRQAIDGGFRADAAFDLRPEPESRAAWRIGLRDIGDGDTLDLQYSERRADDVVRAGLFGGSLGVGYDWNEWSNMGLEGELSNPDDLRLDLRLRLSVQREYGLLLGLEDAFDDADPLVGFRYTSQF